MPKSALKEGGLFLLGVKNKNYMTKKIGIIIKWFYKKILINFIKWTYLNILKKEWFHQTITTFILIAIIGGLYNSYLQNKINDRQREYENYKFQLEKKDYTTKLVSENIDLRFLKATRVLASINSINNWEEYMESVTRWNIQKEQMRQNVAKYFNWEIASIIISEENDSNKEMPKTIHYKFVKLHNYLVDIRNGDYSKIKKAQNLLYNEIGPQKDILITQMIENQIALNGNLK